MVHEALSWHNESSLISWTQSNRGGPLTQQSTNLLLNIQFLLRLVKIYAQPDFWPWVICFTSIDYTAGMTWLARPNRERGERNRHGFIRRQGLLCFSAIWNWINKKQGKEANGDENGSIFTLTSLTKHCIDCTFLILLFYSFIYADLCREVKYYGKSSFALYRSH